MFVRLMAGPTVTRYEIRLCLRPCHTFAHVVFFSSQPCRFGSYYLSFSSTWYIYAYMRVMHFGHELSGKMVLRY